MRILCGYDHDSSMVMESLDMHQASRSTYNKVYLLHWPKILALTSDTVEVHSTGSLYCC